MIVFLHIPKTAGSTFRNILNSLFLPHQICDIQKIDTQYHNNEDLFKNTDISLTHIRNMYLNTSCANGNRIHLLVGHINWDSFSQLNVNRQKCRCIAFLRNPTDQVISNYYYVLKKHPGRLTAGMDSLHDFVSIPYSYNFQSRYFFGEYYKELNEQLSSGKDIKPLIFNFIKENNISIGVSEDFYNSVLLFKKNFRWKKKVLNFTSTNINNERPTIKNIAPETISLIKETNKLDFILYECGVEIFNNHLKKITPFKRFVLKSIDRFPFLGFLIKYI